MPSVRVGLAEANRIISKLHLDGDSHLQRTRPTRLLLIDNGWIDKPWRKPPFIDDLSVTLHDKLHFDYKKLEKILQKAISPYRTGTQEATSERKRSKNAHKISCLADYMNELSTCLHHGTMLTNIARRDMNWEELVGQSNEDHRLSQVLEFLEDSTGLSPNVDLKCLHVDPGKVKNKGGLFRDWDINVPLAAVEATLDRVIALSDRGELQEGDVVIYPAALRVQEGSPDVPIIHSKEVSARIHYLTNQRRLLFVIPAGNEPGIQPVTSPEEIGWSFDGYFNAGASCGATIVDTGLGKKFPFENVGAHRCVDAYLNLYPTRLRRLTTHDCENHGEEQLRKTLADRLACKLHGTSAGSMAVACILATVQEARRLRNLFPLKPYEARSHLRQWKVPSRSIPRSICAPDVLGWLVGTGVFRVGPVEQNLRELSGVSMEHEINRDDIEQLFHISDGNV